MEALACRHSFFLPPAPARSSSLCSDRSPARLTLHRTAFSSSRCLALSRAVTGLARSHSEHFVLGLLRKTPVTTCFLLSLFNFPRRIIGPADVREDVLADHVGSVPLHLSREPNEDLELTQSHNEETFSHSIEGTDAIATLEAEVETAQSSERKQLQDAKFTAEKARLLRQELRSSEKWRNSMYQSAIASRLAAPDS